MEGKKLIRGAEIVIQSLIKEGVEVVFGYPGGANLEIYDALYDYQKKLKHILVRHEQGAAHAADGYARASGKVGVCIATSGPGATNLVTGIATAHMDSIPMVCITGQVNTTAIGTDAFQEADIYGITMPITKHNYLVKDIKDLARTIKEAFIIAKTGRPGPVLIDIPKDITKQLYHFDYPDKLDLLTYKPKYEGNPKQFKKFYEMLQSAQRPVLIAGGGAISANAADEIRQFVKHTKIPIISTLMGLGIYPIHDEYSLGMPGMHGTAYANYAISEADLLISVGMRFDDRITGKLEEFAKKAQIVHFDIDPAEINKCKYAHLPIIGDAAQILKTINAEITKVKLPSYKEWYVMINEWKEKYPLSYKKSDKELKPQQVIEEIARQTKGKAVISVDVGEHQMWAAQYLDHLYPRHWLSSSGLGTMGYGLPASMGAWFADPKKTCINISGDGGVQMNIQELGTLMAENIPVKTFIINNKYLGMVRQWQNIFYENRFSHVDLTPGQPDFVKLAEAYGILGLRCTSPKDVEKTIKQALEHKGPVVVDFQVVRQENVYPMVPAGGVPYKMIFEEE
jgi:acetolactate synthase-1/2/3 large subunit